MGALCRSACIERGAACDEYDGRTSGPRPSSKSIEAILCWLSLPSGYQHSSISSQVTLRTSVERAALSTRNSSANFEDALAGRLVFTFVTGGAQALAGEHIPGPGSQ